MVSGLVMIAVVGILHQVLANPTDQHLTKASIHTDGLPTLVSRLEASLASKDVALQALASSQSKLAREFETCSSEQVKLLVSQQALDLELAKQGERYRQVEADKLTADKHISRLTTENDKLMETVGQLEHANERLLADKVNLEQSLSSLYGKYLATLRDSEAVHKKLLETIKRSKAVEQQMTEKMIAMKKQTQDLLNEKEAMASKLIHAIKDIRVYSDVLTPSEPLVVSPAEELPQDPAALPESTQITEGTHQAEDKPKTCEHDQNKIHQEQPYTVINENSIHSVMNREGIVHGNGIDRNERKSDKRDEMEMKRDDTNTLMDLLLFHVDESGTASGAGLEDSIDNDKDEEVEVKLNDDAAELKESENNKGLDNNNDNFNEAVNGNETKCKYDNNTREELSVPQDKGNTIVDNQSVGNNEGSEYTDENSNNQEELIDNETECRDDENNEREKIKDEKDDYNTLVELMRSLVDEAGRENKGLENITDNNDDDDEEEEEEVKDDKTKQEGEHGVYERTALQASEDDSKEFTYLMDSPHSLIDDFNGEKNDEVTDKEEDELNEEEEEKGDEGTNKMLRDEM